MPDTTARGNLRKPLDGEAADIADLNYNADQISAYAVGPYVCTSGTRPSQKWVGTRIFETDTNRTYMWNGDIWLFESGGGESANSNSVDVAWQKRADNTVLANANIQLPYKALINYFLLFSGGAASAAADFRVVASIVAGSGTINISNAHIQPVYAPSGKMSSFTAHGRIYPVNANELHTVRLTFTVTTTDVNGAYVGGSMFWSAVPYAS